MQHLLGEIKRKKKNLGKLLNQTQLQFFVCLTVWNVTMTFKSSNLFLESF